MIISVNLVTACYMLILRPVVDKRGRPLNNSHHADQLKRFYRLRSASPEQQAFVDYARGQGALASSGSEDEDDSDGVSDSSEEAEELEIGRKRSSRLPKYDLDEDEDSEDGEESESDESHLDIDLSDDGAVASNEDDNDEAEEEEEEEEVLADPTERIAAVNLDWDNLRAVDLFSVFNSFLQSSPGAGSSEQGGRLGRLVNVRIYPSDFGKGRMEQEEREGPGGGIFAIKFDRSGKSKCNGRGPHVYGRHEDDDSDDHLDDHLDEEGNDPYADASDDDEDSQSEEDDVDEDDLNDDEMPNGAPVRSSKGKKNDCKSKHSQPKEIDGLEIISEVSSDDEDGDVNMDQLRQYQLERLRCALNTPQPCMGKADIPLWSAGTITPLLPSRLSRLQ